MSNEQELIQQLKQRQSKDVAFRKLMGLYKERLYWHIRKLVLIHEDTDDVLQNTFIKVYRNIENFNEKSKLYTWLYRIASNEAIDHLKKKAKLKFQDISEYQTAVLSSSQEDNLYDGDRIQTLLHKAIATLPEKQQLVFNMKYFDDMKYQEISDILDTSVGALKSSYFHAVKKIEVFVNNNQLNE